MSDVRGLDVRAEFPVPDDRRCVAVVGSASSARQFGGRQTERPSLLREPAHFCVSSHCFASEKGRMALVPLLVFGWFQGVHG